MSFFSLHYTGKTRGHRNACTELRHQSWNNERWRSPTTSEKEQGIPQDSNRDSFPPHNRQRIDSVTNPILFRTLLIETELQIV